MPYLFLESWNSIRYNKKKRFKKVTVKFYVKGLPKARGQDTWELKYSKILDVEKRLTLDFQQTALEGQGAERLQEQRHCEFKSVFMLQNQYYLEKVSFWVLKCALYSSCNHSF